MKIGLDLDGTVYAHPQFFAALVSAMSAAGHEFFCISSHGRHEWEKDCERLRSLGVDPSLISPDMMYPQRHGDVSKKSAQADQLDVIFDDDFRVQLGTGTVQFAPLRGGNSFVTPKGVIYR